MDDRRRKDEPRLPQNDREAIEFALYHLDPFDIPDFLLDWLNGKSLQPYLESCKHNRQTR